ncbi:MAG: hypothetical protein WKF73_05755 [Nocardioidaceae bacterium]
MTHRIRRTFTRMRDRLRCRTRPTSEWLTPYDTAKRQVTSECSIERLRGVPAGRIVGDDVAASA